MANGRARWSAWGAALILALAGELAACTPATPAATPTVGPTPTDSPQVMQAALDALPPGNADSGKMLFSAVGCVACHSLEAGVRIVGPSLNGVATRAATRKPGYSAELYLYESITNPNAYVVDGFPAGVMPQGFKQRLKPQDLADIIAFLMTQK